MQSWSDQHSVTLYARLPGELAQPVSVCAWLLTLWLLNQELCFSTSAILNWAVLHVPDRTLLVTMGCKCDHLVALYVEGASCRARCVHLVHALRVLIWCRTAVEWIDDHPVGVQVHLGDRPAVAMSQRMSAAIWNGTFTYLGGALLLLSAALTASFAHTLPPDLLPIPALAAAGILGTSLYRLLGPLLEIRKLSGMSAEEIEAAVDVREPLQVPCFRPVFESWHCRQLCDKHESKSACCMSPELWLLLEHRPDPCTMTGCLLHASTRLMLALQILQSPAVYCSLLLGAMSVSVMQSHI